ncbi:hypothetical protein JD844_032420 [Phrynosoma platyrhinos]|uniref:Gem nuclear organelle associated protein 8 n=1 Tax=Phrynosoma platyrhinos TaxID=52577 RepID=A0ABQ7T612_PHRPL|nr:hypothetical protein JD844_032420 [Phrynosoma platyrhinos]
MEGNGTNHCPLDKRCQGNQPHDRGLPQSVRNALCLQFCLASCRWGHCPAEGAILSLAFPPPPFPPAGRKEGRADMAAGAGAGGRGGAAAECRVLRAPFAAEEDSMSQVLEPWYSQKVYARYWKHYSQAMEWMHRHKNAYKKAIESLYNPSFCPPANHPSRRYPDWDEGNHLRDRAFTPHSKSWYCPSSLQASCNTKRREVVVKDSETDTESEDEEDIEYDLSNMEITEELRQYFEQTERHREELRKYLPHAVFSIYT